MVRVLLFHYFKSQRTFSDSLQPTSFASTKDYLFLGTGEMKVFVYSLEQPNFPLFCEFPIMSKPVKLICNEKAKCVLTIERTSRRKNAGSKVVSVQTHSRAYFNWFKANPDEAVRTYAAGHSHYQRQESEGKCKDFLALEIPTQFDVTAICCCPTSGNVAIASVKKVSLFRWSGNLTSGGTDVTAMYHDMEHFLDIKPSMIVKEVVLSDCYLAVRSNLDVQVLKLVFTADQDSVSSSRSGKSSSPGTTLLNKATASLLDFESMLHPTQQTKREPKADNYSLWSFDDCSPLLSSNKPLAVKSDEEVVFPLLRKKKVYKDFLPDPKEILGPVSEVPGHPVTVAFGGLYGIGFAVDGCMLRVKGVTMLYRRFRVEQLSNEGNDSATLHTLQLLPTYTQGISHVKEMQRSPLVARTLFDPTLCGMCCLISGPKEGFMYDVFDTCNLLSYYKYTIDTVSVSVFNGLLHAITRQGIETYTVRIYAAASDWIRKHAAEDVQVDEHQGEEQSVVSNFGGQEENFGEVFDGKKKSDEDLERRDAEDLVVESRSSLASASGSTRSEELLETVEVNQELKESVEQDYCEPCVTENMPSTATAFTPTLSCADNPDATDTASSNKSIKLCGDEAPPAGYKEAKPSPPDIKWTVDNSGRTLVRFTSRSKTSMHREAMTGDMKQFEESEHSSDGTDGEYDTEIKCTRTFTISSSMNRYTSTGAKVSDAVYQAAVIKLSSNNGWPLPVFDLKSLRQRCPQPNLDVCLIGMYPFIGCHYVSASEGNVVLFSKSAHDHLQRSKSFKNKPSRPQTEQRESKNPDWMVYVLQNMDPTQLYKAVMPLANRCQKHNAQAFHHLICEQHFFLRTLCLADSGSKDDKNKKKLKKLLCKSAANLTEVFLRIPDASKDSIDYFAMSGLTLRDIVDKAYKSEEPVADGLIHFLDENLFGSDKQVKVSESITKRIFKLYARSKPGRVAEIILMSSLSGFSSETALAALEDVKKTKTEKGCAYSLSPLDNVVRAVLYLHQCEPDLAQSALFSIPEKKLVEVLTTHFYLLHDDGTHFTPLAQLLRKHQPKLFIEVLLNIHDNKALSVETLLSLFGTSRPDASQNELAVEFMETLLNDQNRLDSFSATVIPLSGIYLERIGNNQRRRQATISHQHIPNGEGHFGTRHPWLDKLSPFNGALCLPGLPGCPCAKPVSPQASPQLSRSSSRFSNSSRRSAGKGPYLSVQRGVDSTASPNECSCCCCNEDLIKIQALLCSKYVSSELADFVLSKIEGQAIIKERTSLLLLCLPHVERHAEAMAIVLDEFSLIALPYAMHYFGQNVEKWSLLVQTLLEMCKEETDSDDSESRKEAIMAVLKGTLQQLCSIVTPREFLGLLPSDGCLGFFLPYLQHCHRRCASGSVSERLATRHLTT